MFSWLTDQLTSMQQNQVWNVMWKIRNGWISMNMRYRCASSFLKRIATSFRDNKNVFQKINAMSNTYGCYGAWTFMDARWVWVTVYDLNNYNYDNDLWLLNILSTYSIAQNHHLTTRKHAITIESCWKIVFSIPIFQIKLKVDTIGGHMVKVRNNKKNKRLTSVFSYPNALFQLENIFLCLSKQDTGSMFICDLLGF